MEWQLKLSTASTGSEVTNGLILNSSRRRVGLSLTVMVSQSKRAVRTVCSLHGTICVPYLLYVSLIVKVSTAISCIMSIPSEMKTQCSENNT